MKRLIAVCFMAAAGILGSGIAWADDKRVIVETLPLSWAVLGANAGAEIGLGSVSIIGDYHHIGNESIMIKFLSDNDLTIKGHIASLGAVHYVSYEEKGNQGLYVGAKGTFGKMSLSETDYSDSYDNAFGKTETTGLGGYFLLGYRWNFEVVSLRIGFNIGGILPIKQDSTDYYVDGEISEDEKDFMEFFNAAFMSSACSGLEIATGFAF